MWPSEWRERELLREERRAERKVRQSAKEQVRGEVEQESLRKCECLGERQQQLLLQFSFLGTHFSFSL